MKKLGIILSIIFITTVIGVGGFLHFSKQSADTQKQQEASSGSLQKEKTHSGSAVKETGKSAEEKVQDKINRIKERLALKGLILNGDTHFQNGENTLALRNYLSYYKKNPDDSLILEKLGDTYFSMHKYTSAVSYYGKLPEVQEKYIASLFHASDLSNSGAVSALLTNIEKLDISEEQKFYLSNSAKCTEDFHTCKLAFSEYFENKKQEEIASSGSLQKTYKPLEDIKISIDNYRNFHLDDVSLKNAYILGSWYKNGQYSLVANIGERLLEEKPDYKVILKLVAQSYFKLGKYEKARDFLGKYNTLNDSDPNVSYMLGIVNTQLREYVLANIHISRAIKLGYENKIEAQRTLIYNFSLLGDEENLLKQFQKLIEDFDYNENDFSLALYYHILYGNYKWPQKIFRTINEKFPENSNIYAYKGWIERETGKLETAKKTLLLGEKLDEKNPFILLSLGYTERELGNIGSALLYFKKAIAANPQSEFAIQAQKEIDTNSYSSSGVLNKVK